MEQSYHTMSAKPAGIKTGKPLRIPFITGGLPDNDLLIAELMDDMPRHSIVNTSWPQYQTLCEAEFSIAYTNNALLVKYYVTNDDFKSEKRKINGPVHFDNCVEFFVRFNNEAGYYNIEFNCLGIGKVAYGTFNKNRQFLPESTVQSIKAITSLNQTTNGFDWELTLIIPVGVFQHSIVSFNNNLVCSGNFYKCGDHLPYPHFLTWNKIDAPKPDFHQPVFFGDILFSDVTERILTGAQNIVEKNLQ